MFAYSSASYPPTSKTITVSDNAFVYFAPIGAEHGDEFSTSSNTNTQRLYEAVSRWAELANNIAIWNYASAFKDYIAPFDDIETAQGYFQAFETMNSFKMYTQGPRETDMSAFEPLRSYVFSNLMRDTSKTVADLKDEFFDGYYGVAATEVESYYNAIQTKFDSLATATGLVQTSLYNSDYWTYDELIGYCDTLNSALSKVAGTAIYNRVLAETMFVRCALLDFYMDAYINAKGVSTVAEELVQFQKDAQVCGFTYAYEGWYAYESSIAYKINAWKMDASLANALALNTKVLKEENYAKTEYSHLYSISVADGLEFRTDGETVALRHQGTAGELTVNAAFLNKMANAGYTQVTVTATTNNGSDNTLDVFKPGSTSEYLASSKTSAANGGKVTHTIALADLYNATAGAYDLRIQTRGWWSGVTLTINELSFSGAPMDYNEILSVIADDSINWAAVEYEGLWTVTSGTKITTGDTVAMKHGSDAYATVASPLLKAAVAEGYTTLTVTSTTNNSADNTFTIYKPDGATALASSKTTAANGGKVTLTVNIADLYSETQNAYDFRLTTAGWWGGVSLTFNSLTFGGKPVDPTEMINEGLANQNTDWSLAEYAELWSTAQGTVVTGDNYAVKKNGTYNSSDHIVSVHPLLIELAVAAGYKTMTVTTTAAGAWNTFTVHKPGTSDFSETGADNYVARAKNGAAGDPVTLTVTLADLYNESTGEYELKMTTAGWWNNVVWTFNSLTFEKPVQIVTLEELFANKTNFAEVAYAEYWATAAGLADISGSHYVAKRNGATASDVVISVNNKLLSEAAKLGYTHLTVTSTVSSGLDNTFVIYRPGVTDFTQYTNSSYYLVSAKSSARVYCCI